RSWPPRTPTWVSSRTRWRCWSPASGRTCRHPCGPPRRPNGNATMVPDPPDAVWLDDDAGPVVRHYAMRLGRTRPTRGEFDLITLIMATRPVTSGDLGLQPEHEAILRHGQSPVSVAEIATRLDL